MRRLRDQLMMETSWLGISHSITVQMPELNYRPQVNMPTAITHKLEIRWEKKFNENPEESKTNMLHICIKRTVNFEGVYIIQNEMNWHGKTIHGH